jgi:multiple sugar transport system permease protein
LCRAQGIGGSTAILQHRPIEALHQLGRGLVVHLPQAGHHPARTGVHEAAGETHEALTADVAAEGGLAGAEHDEVDGEPQVVDLMHAQEAVESPTSVGCISQVTGQLPVRPSVYRNFAFFRDNPWYARFGQMLVHGRARPAVPIYPALSEQLQLAVGYAVSGEKTPEQALEDAWIAVREIDARQRSAMPCGGPRFDVFTLLPAALAVLLALSVIAPLRGRQSGLRAWLAPALVLVVAVLVYPMLDLVRLAFTDTRTHGAAYCYTLGSFRALFADPAFYGMVGVTLVFVASSVALQLGLGLGIALLIDAARRRGAAGTLAAQVAVASGWVIPGVLVGVLWRILLVENRAGIVNYWLSRAGIGPLPLLSSGTLAMASVIAANTWRGCAFTMILQFAGLQRIPRELHEAADLEGLGAWPRFRMVVLPMIAPVVALNLALITIQTLNTFDLILPLTGGGPARRTEVISLYMYRSAFYGLEAGRAAAVAVLMLALNLALAVVALSGRGPSPPCWPCRWSRRW